MSTRIYRASDTQHTVEFTDQKRVRTLHIETDLGIVNIMVGLTDECGRRVESIEVTQNSYTGERKVMRHGGCRVRLVECKAAKT